MQVSTVGCVQAVHSTRAHGWGHSFPPVFNREPLSEHSGGELPQASGVGNADERRLVACELHAGRTRVVLSRREGLGASLADKVLQDGRGVRPQIEQLAAMADRWSEAPSGAGASLLSAFATTGQRSSGESPRGKGRDSRRRCG